MIGSVDGSIHSSSFTLAIEPSSLPRLNIGSFSILSPSFSCIARAGGRRRKCWRRIDERKKRVIDPRFSSNNRVTPSLSFLETNGVTRVSFFFVFHGGYKSLLFLSSRARAKEKNLPERKNLSSPPNRHQKSLLKEWFGWRLVKAVKVSSFPHRLIHS